MSRRFRPSRWLLPGLVAGAFLSAVAWWWGVIFVAPSPAERLEAARDALALGEWARAEELALSSLRADGDRWGWIVAGEAAARSLSVGSDSHAVLTRALAHYQSAGANLPLTDEAQPLWLASTLGVAEMLIGLERWSEAEGALLAAAHIQPLRPEVMRRLADLANFSGRRDAAVPWMQKLLVTPRSSDDDLFHLGDVDHGLDLDPRLVADSEKDAADPLLMMAAAAFALGESRSADAVRLYERAITKLPDNPAAWAGLGLAVYANSPSQLPAWRDRLPEHWRTSDPSGVPSELCQPLSRLAEQTGEYPTALRFAAAEVRARPTSRVAWHRMGRLLARLGRDAEARGVDERALALMRVSLWLDDLFKHRTHADLLRRVSDQLWNLGRRDEAIAWARYALRVLPRADWAAERLQAPPSPPWTDPLDDLVTSILSARDGAPAFGIVREKRVESAATAVDPWENPRIRFADVAESAGLRFVHLSARDPVTPGARIVETTGGGVASLDYDRDGRVDIYLTQGGAVPPDPTQRSQSPRTGIHEVDALYRSLSNGQLQNCTAEARLIDEEFGQGVAAGDLDSDGFPDVYVANIGPNRVLFNLGDGTYADKTPPGIRAAPVWTSSCALADLTGDGHPELFDATYCAGRDMFSRLCGENGVVRSCSPRAFAAERDRCWVNQGDGTWAPGHDGLDLPDGFGLGIVVFRPTREAPLSVFVANDETPNHWLVNTADPGRPPSWSDRALSAGLAVDSDGRPQACMGVACDDLDGDGQFDLFVTNFFHESNTLYRGLNPTLYLDDTRAARLREPGWNMLGFGTQSLDVDADGAPDLLVANGHIDDVRSEAEPFEMPLQLFHNESGVYREVPAREAGPAFERRSLGRGMARLDWNQDGLDDAVVVNQHSPAQLLENRTSLAGSRITVELTGTVSARDAVGTIVVARFGNRTLSRQRTSGDGFQASNEPRIGIGVGDYVGPVELTIHWPQGGTEFRQLSVPGLHAHVRIHCVEGRR